MRIPSRTATTGRVFKPIPRVTLQHGEAARITAERLAWQANGWPLIQGHGKSCRLLGWNQASATPTADTVRSWLNPRAGATKYPTTNLLIDRRLMGLDFDIGERSLMDETWRIALSIAPQLRHALIRGRDDGSPKILALMRRSGKRFTRCSGKWSEDPSGKTAPTFQVEIFASGRSSISGRVIRQVGALGPHTITADGEVTIRYRWRGPSPAEVAFADLLEVNEAEAEAITIEFDRLCARRGFQEVVKSQRSGASFKPKRLFDIAPETIFTDADGGRYTVEELTDLVHAEQRRNPKNARLMITGSFTGDPSSSGSDRCLVGVGHSGLTIYDTKTNTTHLLADRAPPPPFNESVMAEVLRALGVQS